MAGQASSQSRKVSDMSQLSVHHEACSGQRSESNCKAYLLILHSHQSHRAGCASSESGSVPPEYVLEDRCLAHELREGRLAAVRWLRAFTILQTQQGPAA